ncbi:MAG: hypothetical protein FWC69_05645, partial [Defluviitaleaceae bacterium]|nr:hypothetical protein [Defluviitaleaceae bacterium]
LKKKWGVSVAALLYRARALGFLDERNYKLSAIEYSRLGYKRGEPDDLIFILRNRVMEQIIKLYIEKRGFDSQDIMDIFRLRGLPLTIKQIENLLNFDEGEIFELVKVASKSRLTTTRKLEIIR